jgi:type II secretory ATPase GspE/PulE/Tfp pilus assembly ATPase PilB-like protein
VPAPATGAASTIAPPRAPVAPPRPPLPPGAPPPRAGGSGAVPRSARSADPHVIVDLVDRIVADAIAQRASDVHVEPEEAALVVRYRVDGVLRDGRLLPRAMAAPLISRVKIMAGLDIADRMRPQDGRTRAMIDGRGVDLRVSTLPAAHGEKLVLRLLDVGATALTLDALGFLDDDAGGSSRCSTRARGLVLVTGPTGSGKTTTLYAALRRVQQRGVNVVTVEDPVEYRVPGLVQVQVNERAGLTFAAALRSILRQDPDVVLVGEIRDRETATIAVQAALTGHLVLSTLHTIDAPSAVTRLVDVGVEPYRIAAALKGVVAQRLLRRLCPACRVPAPAALDDARLGVAAGGARAPATHVPSGACAPVGAPVRRVGLPGRAAAAEVLLAARAVAPRRRGRAAGAHRRRGARRRMRSLWGERASRRCGMA